MTVLSNPAPFDNISTEDSFTVSDMIEFFESEKYIESELQDRINNSIATDNGPVKFDALGSLIQAASEAIEVINVSILPDAARIVEERIDTLKGKFFQFQVLRKISNWHRQ